jgi:hypothetical protein
MSKYFAYTYRQVWTIEETMDIYPSTTEGQVCIISAFSTPNPEVELSLGNVFNQQIYTDAGQVTYQY